MPPHMHMHTCMCMHVLRCADRFPLHSRSHPSHHCLHPAGPPFALTRQVESAADDEDAELEEIGCSLAGAPDAKQDRYARDSDGLQLGVTLSRPNAGPRYKQVAGHEPNRDRNHDRARDPDPDPEPEPKSQPQPRSEPSASVETVLRQEAQERGFAKTETEPEPSRG